MKRIFLCLLAAGLILGCEEAKQAVQTPPVFGRGDQVAAKKSQQVGIITSAFTKEDDPSYWRYRVMFRDNEMYYREIDLVLVERFDWNKLAIKAEIEKNVKVDP